MYFIDLVVVILHWLSAVAGVLSLLVVPVVHYLVGVEGWMNAVACIPVFILSAVVFLITADAYRDITYFDPYDDQ